MRCGRGEMTEQSAVAWLVTFDPVEDQRRRIGRMLAVEHVDDGAHFQIPIDIFERREFAALVDYRQPIPQAVIVHDSSLGKFIDRKERKGRKVGAGFKRARTVGLISLHQVCGVR